LSDADGSHDAQGQFEWLPGMVFVVRTRTVATAFGRALVDIIHDIDPALPVADVRTLDQNLSRVLARRRFHLVMLTGIALAAVGLAVVGIFGVMAHAVAQRRQEIGVRQALGARTRDITGLVLARTLRITLVGLAGGTVVAFDAHCARSCSASNRRTR
jgi:ABC-type antimicrobial peptide transport system permease subunit